MREFCCCFLPQWRNSCTKRRPRTAELPRTAEMRFAQMRPSIIFYTGASTAFCPAGGATSSRRQCLCRLFASELVRTLQDTRRTFSGPSTRLGPPSPSGPSRDPASTVVSRRRWSCSSHTVGTGHRTARGYRCMAPRPSVEMRNWSRNNTRVAGSCSKCLAR